MCASQVSKHTERESACVCVRVRMCWKREWPNPANPFLVGVQSRKVTRLYQTLPTRRNLPPKKLGLDLATLLDLEGNSFGRVWRHLYLSLPLPPPAPLYKHGVSNKTEPTTRKTLTSLRRSAPVALKDAVVLAPVLSAPVSFLALAAPSTLASSARP